MRASGPMLAGCLRAGTHYLDITGEIAVFEDIHSRNHEIRGADIVAIPGVARSLAYTPSMAFGADYMLQLEGTKLSRVKS